MMKDTLVTALFLILSFACKAQEVLFFSEGTDNSYYDQGIVDTGNLGNSVFEHTFPPGLPQYNDKVPCSTIAYKGSTSLKFNYTSAPNGNWKVSIFRSGWSSVDLTGMDSLSFWVYSSGGVPSYALPMIGLVAVKTGGTSDVSSKLYRLSDFNITIPAARWTRIAFPVSIIRNDSENSLLNFSAVKGVIFNQSETNNTSRTLYLDEITAYKSIDLVPPVSNLSATGYDSHAELTWTRPLDNLSYRIQASYDGGKSFILRDETDSGFYLDFVPAEGRNSGVIYRVTSVAGGKESAYKEATASIRDFSDDELLDMVQRYTFRYFWEGAHQTTGMALERTDGGSTTVASGATGMGLMAMVAAFDREYKPGEVVKDRILKILTFLETCDRHHGAWSHWYNAGTAHTQPFSADDDGGDIVETSYVAQALIALKNYFSGNDVKSLQIREKADLLWKGIDWNWYRQGGQNGLFWHWSPTVGFKMNMKVTGWNECLVTYIMAASSPTHGIPAEVYTQGWARNGNMVSKRSFYNTDISLSPDWGGPLFWIHYSHLGINPHNLSDIYADYWKEHVNTAKIQYAYALANPRGWYHYGEKCWGLTASDDPYGYTAHQPVSNDNGTISPTAALSSIPYLPDEAMKALKYFYRDRGKELFGPYGFWDAFNDNLHWVKKACLGIDQGPVMVMIENYRTGLLWKNVMKDNDVQTGLKKLGFSYVSTALSPESGIDKKIKIYPNPCSGKLHINTSGSWRKLKFSLFSPDGICILTKNLTFVSRNEIVDCSFLSNGLYIVSLEADGYSSGSVLTIQK
jgi:hypothetical protein